MYEKHNYDAKHIWNSNETGIQASRRSSAEVLAKRGSHQVYNIIPRSREWLIVNCVVNATRKALP